MIFISGLILLTILATIASWSSVEKDLDSIKAKEEL